MNHKHFIETLVTDRAMDSMMRTGIAWRYHYEDNDLMKKSLVTLEAHMEINFIEHAIKVYQYLSNTAFLEKIFCIVALKEARQYIRINNDKKPCYCFKTKPIDYNIFPRSILVEIGGIIGINDQLEKELDDFFKDKNINTEINGNDWDVLYRMSNKINIKPGETLKQLHTLIHFIHKYKKNYIDPDKKWKNSLKDQLTSYSRTLKLTEERMLDLASQIRSPLVEQEEKSRLRKKYMANKTEFFLMNDEMKLIKYLSGEVCNIEKHYSPEKWWS